MRKFLIDIRKNNYSKMDSQIYTKTQERSKSESKGVANFVE